MTSYTRVQFIGYALPTTPLMTGMVGTSPGSFAEGRYVGMAHGNPDIDARIELTMSAVEQTVRSGAVDGSPSTLKIFVMPEFAFRGVRGAYDNNPPEIDAFTYFRTAIAKRVAVPAYEGWLFVFGTIVEATNYVRGNDPGRDRAARIRENLAMALGDAWQYAESQNDTEFANFLDATLRDYTNYCRAKPIYEVSDKSYVVAGGAADATYPEGLTVEKKFISNEDFVLNLISRGFCGDQCAYPPIKEQDGEDKETAFDDLSIFTIKGIKFGVEVCLDHARARLRTNRLPENEVVQIHLVPSCGMQLVDASIIAGAGGLVFNCDGQYDATIPGLQPDATTSVWTVTASNRAHSQLTEVVTPAIGKDLTAGNAVLKKPAATVTTVPIQDPGAAAIYAYGPGEVHVYTAVPIPPAA
jgi:hypothetical protein